jgi:hypothetical protein
VRPAPSEPPIRTREAAAASAAVVLLAAGFLFTDGWPLVLIGFVLLACVVLGRARS